LLSQESTGAKSRVIWDCHHEKIWAWNKIRMRIISLEENKKDRTADRVIYRPCGNR
jgi:hypothetical protein